MTHSLIRRFENAYFYYLRFIKAVKHLSCIKIKICRHFAKAVMNALIHQSICLSIYLSIYPMKPNYFW